MTRDHISRNEIRKDAVQDTLDATITAVGRVGGIVTGAVREVAHTVGDLASDVFEIRDAARKAKDEHSSGDPTAKGDTDEDV